MVMLMVIDGGDNDDGDGDRWCTWFFTIINKTYINFNYLLNLQSMLFGFEFYTSTWLLTYNTLYLADYEW